MKYKSFEKFDLFFFVVTVILILIFGMFAKAQSNQISAPEIASTGGAFSLEKAVIAGGGSAKQAMPFSEHGTAGQAFAGIKSNGGQFSLYVGFWTPEDFAPTATGVSVGGRIKNVNDKGINGVRVTITYPDGASRTTFSKAFGHYSFTDIPAGGTYVVSVAAKHYTFSQPTQVRQILEDTSDVDFIADAFGIIK